MLRLLPERLYTGLLGDGAWLAQGTKGHPLPMPSFPSHATPVEMLGAMLQADIPKRRARKLSVMLPGHAARCVSLPWSPHLRSGEEKKAYALAHFEQAGLGVADSHAILADFRHYGAKGFAYAVPHDLLEQLHGVAASHSVELTTVIPTCGVAHMAARPARGTGLELLLVIENSAVSALVMDRVGLQRYDSEPTIGGEVAGLRRLMTRLVASASEYKGITMCSVTEDEAAVDIARSFTADAVVRRVTPQDWRRYL